MVGAEQKGKRALHCGAGQVDGDPGCKQGMGYQISSKIQSQAREILDPPWGRQGWWEETNLLGQSRRHRGISTNEQGRKDMGPLERAWKGRGRPWRELNKNDKSPFMEGQGRWTAHPAEGRACGTKNPPQQEQEREKEDTP